MSDPRFVIHPRLSRRQALRTVAGGVGAAVVLSVIPVRARAAMAEVPERLRIVVRDRLGDRHFRDGRIQLTLPDRADTGMSVPVSVAVPGSPMSPDDFVRSLHVFAPSNRQPLVADYFFSPRSGRAEISQRMRLAQSQHVFAFGIMSDDSAWMTAHYITVALGACAAEIFLPDAQPVREGL
jgi:sulfur-oxidizing protein SoxY